MLFAPEAQDAFWSAMQPDIRSLFDSLEKKERWSISYEDNQAFFTKMADALPRVATLPIDHQSQSILVSMIPLLSSMPLRQCIFAVHWLNNQNPDIPIGWGTLCYLEALNIVNNIKDHEHYNLAHAMVDRISAVMRVRKEMALFAQWPLKINR
jgi:hypothetical protein